jgi:methionyl-tRNA formyltransferase
MRILAFCDKITGLSLLKTLHLDMDEYFVVVGKRDRAKICDWLKDHRVNHALEEDFKFEKYEESYFDWLLNLWGSHIFITDELNKTKNSLNVHPGLLPEARGSNPVIHAMLNGNAQGVTIHEIEESVDSGAIYCRQEIDCSELLTGGEVYEKVVNDSIELFSKKWPEIRDGRCSKGKTNAEPGKLQTKRETEKLRTKDFENLNEDEKSMINWILSFQYNKDYRAKIQYKGKTINLEAEVEE